MRKKLLVLSIITLAMATTTKAQFWKKKDKDDPKTDSAAPPKEEKKKSGGGFFQKVVGKLAKGAAKVGGAATGATKTTSELSVIEPNIYLMSNLLPKEIGTLDMDFFNGWKGGSDLVGVMFMPKDRLFSYKVEGSIKMDGKEADYQTTGVYTKVLDPGPSSRTLEVETKSGQKARFTLQPNPNQVKLVSINNQTNNCQIDVNKDFSIQLSGYSTKPGALVKVRIVASAIGIRSTYDVGNFKPAGSITIPGYILKHINGSNKNMGYKNTYLIVDDAAIMEVKDEAGKYAQPVKYIAMTSSALPVKLSTDPALFEGLEAEGTEKLPSGKMEYAFTKPNAFNGRPMDHLGKIAVTTFAVSGTTYFYDKKENKFLDQTREKEAQFPQLPDAVWNNVLERMYPKLTQIIQEELGGSFLPPSAVPNTTEYQAIAPYANSDANTKEHFSKAYMGLKKIPDALPLAVMYTGEPALFKATGANALLKVNLNFQISFDNKPILQPILEVELLGEKNGGDLGLFMTKYFSAEITGEGFVIKNNKELTAEVFEKEVVRMDDLMATFRKGLQELKAKEKANGEYLPIWNLQK